jgi:hypothetical protein
MFFPALMLFVELRDLLENKKFEENFKIVKTLLTQFLIAGIASLVIILIFRETNLTIHLFLEFFALLSLWIFFISLIAFLIYILYSYFGEA